MSSRGHKHTVPQKYPSQHGREAPMARREACSFPLLLVSNYKSVSSYPVGSCDLMGQQGLLDLLPGLAEEAFISCFPAGHRNAKSPFLFTPFAWSDAQLLVQSWVACPNFLQLSTQPVTTSAKEAASLLWNFYKTKYVRWDRLLNYSHFTFTHNV